AVSAPSLAGAATCADRMLLLGGVLELLCGPAEANQLDPVHKVPVFTETVTVIGQTVEEEAAPEANAVEPLTASMLREDMDASAADILPWDGRRFRRVKQLQEAKRNHGCVELMRESGTFVAVKKMPTRWIRGSPDEFDSRHPDSVERPWMDVGLVRRLNEISYPYSVKLLGVFADEKSTYVVSSLASEGDLFAWCDREPKPGPRREAAMHPLASQIFKGVRWLHDLGIAHRDLSLENILLHSENGDLRIKIIDFGMATLDRLASASAEVGKQSYQAPEVHLSQPCDTIMTDPFSLGVVLFAMAAQDYPWKSTARNTCELFEYACMFGFTKFLGKRRLRKGAGESLAEVFSPNFTALLASLLATDVEKRLTLGEKCFDTPENGSDRKNSVWDCKWMQQPLVTTTEVDRDTDLHVRNRLGPPAGPPLSERAPEAPSQAPEAACSEQALELEQVKAQYAAAVEEALLREGAELERAAAAERERDEAVSRLRAREQQLTEVLCAREQQLAQIAAALGPVAGPADRGDGGDALVEQVQAAVGEHLQRGRELERLRLEHAERVAAAEERAVRLNEALQERTRRAEAAEQRAAALERELAAARRRGPDAEADDGWCHVQDDPWTISSPSTTSE
ncbi:unnamed protein product, partial [Prorocentrum cordatum]